MQRFVVLYGSPSGTLPHKATSSFGSVPPRSAASSGEVNVYAIDMQWIVCSCAAQPCGCRRLDLAEPHMLGGRLWAQSIEYFPHK